MFQLAQWSLPTPEVHGSTPVIGRHFLTDNCIKLTKIKKRPGVDHFKIQHLAWHCYGELRHSQWMFKVTRLFLTDPNALFQQSVVKQNFVCNIGSPFSICRNERRHFIANSSLRRKLFSFYDQHLFLILLLYSQSNVTQ